MENVITNTILKSRSVATKASTSLLCVILMAVFSCIVYSQEFDEYADLGFEPVDAVTEFRFMSFRRTDDKSILVTGRSGESYLLVVDGRVSPTVEGISFSTGRSIRVNYTRVILSDRSGQTSQRIVAIFPISSAVEANSLVRRLRDGGELR